MGRSSIVAVGGAEDKVDKKEILERFVRESGGARSRIAILATASSVPEEKAPFYQQLFTELGATEAYHVAIASREEAESADGAAALASATGVFLTGGDQSRLVSVLSGTRAMTALRKRLVDGCVLAGTSAGASAFSSTMIVGGENGLNVHEDAVQLGNGLGIITRLIIDQHFAQRHRLGRLLSAVALEPERLGVGIDEDTAMVYHGNGRLEVIGSGQVFVVDGSQALLRKRPPERRFSVSGAVLHVLNDGDVFDVPARRLLAQGAAVREPAS
jgi:cyanophycinase